MMARWTSDQLGAGARVEEHLDRRAALEGADFVVNMVQIGMHEATLLDFEIPKKYGLKQTIADSMGIGGIFRGLRTIPFVLDLAGEMRRALPESAAPELHEPHGHPDGGAVHRKPRDKERRALPQRPLHRARDSLVHRRASMRSCSSSAPASTTSPG